MFLNVQRLQGETSAEDYGFIAWEFVCCIWHSSSLQLLFLQRGDVRFLICTDVAARGIDIHGVPYGKAVF